MNDELEQEVQNLNEFYLNAPNFLYALEAHELLVELLGVLKNEDS